MSFEPIQTDSRRSLGARFAYSVRKANTKATGRLRISICAEVMRKANFSDGDRLRLDVDAEAGLGRLVQVITTGGSVRRVELRSPSTGRGHYELPWTGAVPLHFPAAQIMTELEVVEIKAGEVTFDLAKPTAETSAPLKKGGEA